MLALLGHCPEPVGGGVVVGFAIRRGCGAQLFLPFAVRGAAPQHQCAAASPPPPATAPGPAPAPMMMMMPLAAAAAAGTTPMLTPLRGMSPVNNGASTAALVQEPADLPRAPDSAACASSFIKRADSVPMMLNAMTTSAVVAAIARAVSG